MKVFNWLVGKINEAHTSGSGAAVAETVAFVGILDIFGRSGCFAFILSAKNKQPKRKERNTYVLLFSS